MNDKTKKPVKCQPMTSEFFTLLRKHCLPRSMIQRLHPPFSDNSGAITFQCYMRR